MKNFTLLFFTLFMTVALQAQSSRLVLVEEFTGETCGPCAGANPGMNARIDANAGKVISLKYQNNIPSAGANLYAYNTADVATRTTYYANNYSPHAFLDGNVWDDNAGGLTEALILNRAAVPTPFSVVVTHTFSANKDSIYTKTVVTANSAVNSPNYNVRIAVSERNIYGYTSPNGEDEFSHVMRKLLPNGNGLDLPTSWTAGQSATFEQAWKIAEPTSAVISKPIWALLEVISWVQDDATKEVIQAGHSPAQITTDISLSGHNAELFTCTPVSEIEIEVKNPESVEITSFSTSTKIDGGTATTFDWTGTLAAGATTTLKLPLTGMTPGTHQVSVTITSFNGAADAIPSNNSITARVGSLKAATNIAQSFTATTWPPVDWLVINPDNGATWTRSTSGLNGAGSARMNFYNSLAGKYDYLWSLSGLDLTIPGLLTPTLRFDLAHKMYDAVSFDQIDVEVSTDCGSTWTSIWSKKDPELATTTGFTGDVPYTPTAAHWRAETVDLSAYKGQKDVMVRFAALSGFGNMAFIDNINTLFTSNIDDLVANANLEVYPNPASEAITLDFSTLTRAEVGYQITNTVGQVVSTIAPYQLTPGAHKVQLPVSHLASGLYFVTLNTNEGVLTRSFTVSH
jgi:hypothetical protein